MLVLIVELCEDPYSFSNYERALDELSDVLDPDAFEAATAAYRMHIDQCPTCLRKELVTIELEGRHICDCMGIPYKSGYTIN